MIKIIENVSVYNEEIGTGIPVICIHGFGVDSNIMKGALEPFFENHSGYRRIYIDLIGMGKTPANYSINGTDDLLKIMAALIKELMGTESFILAGLSFGGYLSLGLIEQFKNQVSGVLFICPCTIGKHQNRILPKRQIIKKEQLNISKDEEADFQAFSEMAVIINEYTWARYKKEILPGVKNLDNKYINSLPKEGYPLSHEKSIRLAKFENPASFILAKQDDVVGYQDALALEPNFPRGSFALIDGAGHNLPIEKPEIFNALLLDFLNAIK